MLRAAGWMQRQHQLAAKLPVNNRLTLEAIVSGDLQGPFLLACTCCTRGLQQAPTTPCRRSFTWSRASTRPLPSTSGQARL